MIVHKIRLQQVFPLLSMLFSLLLSSFLYANLSSIKDNVAGTEGPANYPGKLAVHIDSRDYLDELSELSDKYPIKLELFVEYQICFPNGDRWFRYYCSVEPGQELFWIAVLGQYDFVVSVEWVTISSLSNRRFISPPQSKKPSPMSSTISVAVGKHRLMKKVLDALAEHFSGKGTVKPLILSDVYLEAGIVNLRGEVVHERKYWEKLTIHATLMLNGKILILVEGEYAEGLEANPPPQSAYFGMEKEHYEELEDFTKTLAGSISKQLNP